jgi:hypothetical protein
MTRPLRSTPTAPSRGFTATTNRSASAPRIGTQSLAGSPRLERSLSPPPAGSTGTRLLTFHARAADQDHVAYVPDATRPISGHPPGSSRSTPHTPRFRRHFDFDNDTSPAISTFETAHRLPDPHLTHPLRLFRVAHHDGLQPTQHTAVWSLPPQGDSEGPILHLSHSTASKNLAYITSSSLRS